MLGRVLYIKDDQKRLNLFLNTTFWLGVWAMGWCMTCVYQNCASCVRNRKSSTSQRSCSRIFTYKKLTAFFLIITTTPGQIKSLVFCCLIIYLSLSLYSLAVPFLRLDMGFWNKHCIPCLHSISKDGHSKTANSGEGRGNLGKGKLDQPGSWAMTQLSDPCTRKNSFFCNALRAKILKWPAKGWGDDVEPSTKSVLSNWFSTQPSAKVEVVVTPKAGPVTCFLLQNIFFLVCPRLIVPL